MSDVAAAETTGERPRQAGPRARPRPGIGGNRPAKFAGRFPRSFRTRSRRAGRGPIGRLEPLIWLGPALILIGVVVLWPVVTLIQTSTQNITPIGVTIGSAGAGNYTTVFHNPNLPGILVRTVVWVVSVVSITMVLSLGLAQLFNQRFPGRRVVRWALIAVLVALVAMPAAYYTARHRFRGRRLFLLIVLATQILQPTALIVGIYKEFLSFHLLDTVWSLILVNAGFNLAFAVWILSAYFASIPVEIEEAAMVDGSGRLGTLRRVTLPLAMPGVVTALIFTFIAAWNAFVAALTLATSNDVTPLTVRLDSFIGQYTVDWQHLFGASVVATIPVLILFALIERTGASLCPVGEAPSVPGTFVRDYRVYQAKHLCPRTAQPHGNKRRPHPLRGGVIK
ncbi:MAG: carbohydrate ABC transporter permease [Streptosporangiaceae bacterium]